MHFFTNFAESKNLLRHNIADFMPAFFCAHTFREKIMYFKNTAPCRGVETPAELCNKGLDNT